MDDDSEEFRAAVAHERDNNPYAKSIRVRHWARMYFVILMLLFFGFYQLFNSGLAFPKPKTDLQTLVFVAVIGVPIYLMSYIIARWQYSE